jgi:hypothetical protein
MNAYDLNESPDACGSARLRFIDKGRLPLINEELEDVIIAPSAPPVAICDFGDMLTDQTLLPE